MVYGCYLVISCSVSCVRLSEGLLIFMNIASRIAREYLFAAVERMVKWSRSNG